jgi:hypothetical protein
MWPCCARSSASEGPGLWSRAATADSIAGRWRNPYSRTNSSGFRFSTTRLPGDDSVDLQTILTHELGHFQGLAHSSNDRAVMWPEAGRGEARRDLTFDDTAGLCAVYPPALAPAGVRCNPVPYGGLATLPGGAKVTAGACAATPATPATGGAAGVAVVALAALAVKKARGALRKTARRAAVNNH